MDSALPFARDGGLKAGIFNLYPKLVNLCFFNICKHFFKHHLSTYLVPLLI